MSLVLYDGPRRQTWTPPKATGAGLKLWLRADRGLFQDSGGTTPATADGDPVGLWQDGSGQGNHVSQATASKRPTLRLGVTPSGRPVVRFDGVDDWLGAASNFISGWTQGHLFARLKVASDPASSVTKHAVWRFSATAVEDTYYPWNNGNLYTCFLSTANVNANVGPDLTQWHVYEELKAGGSVEARIDGATVLGPAARASGGNLLPRIGGDGSGSVNADLDLAELVLYDGPLSAAEEALAVGYLGY